MPAKRENTESPASPNFCRLIALVCKRVEERKAAVSGGYTLELVSVGGERPTGQE